MGSKNKIYFLLCILFVAGCNTQKAQEDSILNEAKWTVYSLNFNKKAIDGTNKDVPSIDFVQSSIVDINRHSINEDTVEIIFSFSDRQVFDKQSANYYVARPYHCAGVVIVDDVIIYPLCDIDIMDNQSADSVEAFLKYENQRFEEYLKKYNGDIDPWLQKEAKRRGVL